jgi:hypothetical protein
VARKCNSSVPGLLLLHATCRADCRRTAGSMEEIKVKVVTQISSSAINNPHVTSEKKVQVTWKVVISKFY